MLRKDDVARAAAGRWREILLSLCTGLSVQALNGTHEKPCPKCGGNTRFKAFPDFDEKGGLFCSHCHSDRNADGFAAVQWWHGCDFFTALKMVAEFLKFAPSQLAGSASAGANSSRENPQPPQPVDWSAKWSRVRIGDGQRDDVLRRWCAAKPPIVPESVLSAGVMFGNWPKSDRGQLVLGFHGFGADESRPNSLLLYRADGSEFPAFAKLPQRKTHLVGGSAAGWVHLGGVERTRSADVVWRVEGLPDGLALLPLLPLNHAVVSPATGCGWNRNTESKNPPLGIFVGKVVIGVGDADAPGQRGLCRWAVDVAKVAARLFLAALPFEMAETHGADLRDWIGVGADLAAIKSTLGDYARLSGLLSQPVSMEVEFSSRLVVGPLQNYVAEGKHVSPMPISEIQDTMWSMTENWPRRVAERLFVHDGERISWIGNPAALVSWFGLRTGSIVDFADLHGLFSKKEFYEGLQQSAIEYKAVENSPHEPPIDGHYYACGEYLNSDGSHLEWLLDRFCVDQRADRDLILLMMATVFWGGGGGQRPAFMITANGTGAGKTTLASVVAELAGGMISVGQRDSMREITERMLTAEGRDKRILFVDNIKATRFSSAEIEALVTSPTISGRALYIGEAQRPNTLTWIMTMNGVGLSKDIADRVVVVRLKRPEYSGTWADDTMAFVRKHRREIICDLLTFLRGPKDDLNAATRWGAWNDGVLCRLSLPEDAAALIHERQRESDVDGDEASLVQDYFRDRLSECGYVVETAKIFIPSRIANVWHSAAMNERLSMTKTNQWLKTQIEQSAITMIVMSRYANRRGFIWHGSQATDQQPVSTDLEDAYERQQYAKHEPRK